MTKKNTQKATKKVEVKEVKKPVTATEPKTTPKTTKKTPKTTAETVTLSNGKVLPIGKNKKTKNTEPEANNNTSDADLVPMGDGKVVPTELIDKKEACIEEPEATLTDEELDALEEGDNDAIDRGDYDEEPEADIVFDAEGTATSTKTTPTDTGATGMTTENAKISASLGVKLPAKFVSGRCLGINVTERMTHAFNKLEMGPRSRKEWIHVLAKITGSKTDKASFGTKFYMWLKEQGLIVNQEYGIWSKVKNLGSLVRIHNTSLTKLLAEKCRQDELEATRQAKANAEAKKK